MHIVVVPFLGILSKLIFILQTVDANLSLEFKVTRISANNKPANCNVANTTYAHGETFKLDCKTQCVCENGRHACSTLCPKEQLPAPEDTESCRSPRLVDVPGHCCKMWLCENPTADVYATCHNSSTSPWTPCSRPCGLGISTRFAATTAGCSKLSSLRLCENRKCDNKPQDKGQIVGKLAQHQRYKNDKNDNHLMVNEDISGTTTATRNRRKDSDDSETLTDLTIRPHAHRNLKHEYQHQHHHQHHHHQHRYYQHQEQQNNAQQELQPQQKQQQVQSQQQRQLREQQELQHQHGHRIKKMHDCHVAHNLGPSRIRLGQCVSRKLYRPKICGHCHNPSKCCVPSVSTTIQVELLCPLNAPDPISYVEQQLNNVGMQQQQQQQQQQEQSQGHNNYPSLSPLYLWDTHTLDPIDQEYLQSHQIQIENKFIAVEWILKCKCSINENCRSHNGSSDQHYDVGNKDINSGNISGSDKNNNRNNNKLFHINNNNENTKTNNNNYEQQNNNIKNINMATDSNDYENMEYHDGYDNIYEKQQYDQQQQQQQQQELQNIYIKADNVNNNNNNTASNINNIYDNVADNYAEVYNAENDDDKENALNDLNLKYFNNPNEQQQKQGYTLHDATSREQHEPWSSASSSSDSNISDEIQPDIIPYPPSPFLSRSNSNNNKKFQRIKGKLLEDNWHGKQKQKHQQQQQQQQQQYYSSLAT